jgi:hypothetical protein
MKMIRKRQASEGVLMLTNMLHYAEKQVEINKTLERAFTAVVKLQDLKKEKTDRKLSSSLPYEQ